MNTDSQKILGWCWLPFSIACAMAIVILASCYLMMQCEYLKQLLRYFDAVGKGYQTALGLSLLFAWQYACPGLWAMALWTCVRYFRRREEYALRQYHFRWLAISLTLGLTAYGFWICCQFRTAECWEGRPFPYPDLWLLKLHDWLDRAYSVSWSIIKYHGEIFRMKLIVGSVTVMACLLSMYLLDPIVRQLNRDVQGPQCLKCGYDLRGTVDAGHQACPECGCSCSSKASAS